MAATCAPGRFVGTFWSLNTTEYSPALAKRNDVPHDPRTVAPSISSTSQVKANFGLLVPPFSAPFGLLYWSCRHEASRSSLRTSGRLKLSPKIGMSSWANPAQTVYGSGSIRGAIAGGVAVPFGNTLPALAWMPRTLSDS